MVSSKHNETKKIKKSPKVLFKHNPRLYGLGSQINYGKTDTKKSNTPNLDKRKSKINKQLSNRNTIKYRDTNQFDLYQE